MTVRIVVLAAAFLVFGPWHLPAFSAFAGGGLPLEDAPFLLKEKYDRESNPKDRVKIAIKLTDALLKQMRSAYKSEAFAKGKEAVKEYLSAVELLKQAVVDASDTGYSKRAEIHLRQQARKLENLKMSLSVMDRAPVEKAAQRVTSLREEILYRIMKPRNESARK